MSIKATNDSLVITENEFKIPIYIKASIFLIGAFIFIWMMYIAQGIIIPLVFATIIAIVLHPVVKFFVRKKINRVLAIIITLLLTFLVIAAFGILIFSQANEFGDSWPILVDRFTEGLNQTTTWISGYFDLKPRKIHEWILNTKAEIINNSTSVIRQTLVTLGSVLLVLILVPVYVFMLLFYYPLLIDFVRKLFGDSHRGQVSELVTKTKTVIQHYLTGLLIEATIIATLYTITLLVFGVDYAILLAIIGALINLIPYIGGLVGVALPVIVSLGTKSTGWTALYIILIYYLIHIIDNNYIIPKIVASKVKINALFSIIAVIVGHALWGIPGMFLSIPLLGIIKLIFDHIESLKPWGFLLGDTMPQQLIIKPILKKLKLKS